MDRLELPDEYSAQRRTAQERRIQQLSDLLDGRKDALILMHNDPDPDAIACGCALDRLLHYRIPDLKTTISHGGMIGRAENRTMVDLFAPTILHTPMAEAGGIVKKYDAILMVDTQPIAGNHLLYGVDYPEDLLVLAIDHHPPRRSQVRALIHDVRPEVGACSSLLFEYLAVAGVPFDGELATALFYGIKSDTRGLSRHTDILDVWAYTALRNLTQNDLLSQIEQVQLPRSYFRSLSDALSNTVIYPCQPAADRQNGNDGKEGEEKYPCSDNVVVSLLFDMRRPDMASEVADMLLRLENVSWAICLGIYDGRLVISVRSENPEARAGRLVRSIVGRSGSAGGHDTMAGGRIHMPDSTPAERIAELHALVPRFLRELGIANATGLPLLSSTAGD